MRSAGWLLSTLVLSLLLGACRQVSPLAKEGEERPSGRLTSTDKEAVVPKKLVQDIEAYYLKNYKLANPEKEIGDGEIMAGILRKTMDLKISLASSSDGVLVGNADFGAGRGGAYLDLAEWVTGVRGDFYLGVKAKLEEGLDSNLLKVFFISDSPSIEIDGENWGLGCGKYADITDYYKKSLSSEGVRLNSTRNRYLYAVSGRFLFVTFGNENLYLTSFSVTDSRYRDKLCGALVTQSDDFE